MRLMRLFFILGVCAVSGHARAYDHALAKTYFVSASAALYADGHCKELQADKAKINLFKSRAGLSEEDNAQLEKAMAEQKTLTEAYAQKMGEEAWCGWAYGALGPRSSLGFLRRKDPMAN